MCGLAGFVGRGDRSDLAAMTNAQAHRGPDAEGFHIDPAQSVFLGHRRLSIRDATGGTQPMWNEDNTVCVIFNGEIYNHVELRRELEQRGHTFPIEPFRHRSSGARLRRVGRGACRAIERHVRVRDLRREAPASAAGARPLRREAAVLFQNQRPVCICQRVERADPPLRHPGQTQRRGAAQVFRLGLYPRPHSLLRRYGQTPRRACPRIRHRDTGGRPSDPTGASGSRRMARSKDDRKRA